MKTERRHELQTNQLADWIGHQYDHVKPHTKTILAAAILSTAVIITAMVLMQDAKSRGNGAGSASEEDSIDQPAARKPATGPKASSARAQRK